MNPTANRLPLIDALKAIAALFVLLTHFASYGPLATAAREILPATVEWIYGYGRIAVQVFLVIAGFLAARALSARGEALHKSPLRLIWKRYLRLAVPYLAAIGLATAGAALADRWMDDEAIPTRATFGQWLAHALLLQSLLGFESLSAGVWYIAIDFQLFALMAVLLWLGRVRLVAPALVLLTAGASLFWFNRDSSLDNWAIYFFGSYGLGAAAWWASERRQMSAWLGVIATIGIAALVVDFRLRIALALGVALLLGFARRGGILETWPNVRPLAFLGRISYSVFLVHFPILLLANALYVRLELDSPGSALLCLGLGGLASIGIATLFHHGIEGPAASRRIADSGSLLLERSRQLLGRLSGLANRFAHRA